MCELVRADRSVTDQTIIPDLEQVDFSPEHQFQLGMATRMGPFEVGLEAFLSKIYLEEVHISLDKGWNILNFGRRIDPSFLFLKQSRRLDYNTIIFDVAGSGQDAESI